MGSYNRFNRTYHKTMINLDRFPLEGDKPELTVKPDPVFRFNPLGSRLRGVYGFIQEV